MFADTTLGSLSGLRLGSFAACQIVIALVNCSSDHIRVYVHLVHPLGWFSGNSCCITRFTSCSDFNCVDYCVCVCVFDSSGT